MTKGNMELVAGHRTRLARRQLARVGSRYQGEAVHTLLEGATWTDSPRRYQSMHRPRVHIPVPDACRCIGDWTREHAGSSRHSVWGTGATTAICGNLQLGQTGYEQTSDRWRKPNGAGESSARPTESIRS
jgi:hypothetical protein